MQRVLGWESIPFFSSPCTTIPPKIIAPTPARLGPTLLWSVTSQACPSSGPSAHFTPSSFRNRSNHQGMGRQRKTLPGPRGVPWPDALPPAARRGLSGRQPPALGLKQPTRWRRARSRRGREAATCGAARRGPEAAGKTWGGLARRPLPRPTRAHS